MKTLIKILLTIVLVMEAVTMRALAIPGSWLVMAACTIAIYYLWKGKKPHILTREEKEANLQATREAARRFREEMEKKR